MRLFTRALAFLVFLFAYCVDAGAQFPSPQFATVTAQSVNTGTLSSTGPNTLAGGGSLIGTFGGPTVLTNVLPNLTKFFVSTLPPVTTADVGKVAYATDCTNGSENPPGTGCLYEVNSLGVWTAMPTPTNLQIIIGGQPIRLGGSTINQGNGSKLQLSTGTTTNGDCAQFDVSGNIVDSGSACGAGGGGSGTVTASPQNGVAYFTNAGTASVVGGLAVVNNAVVVTSNTGVPSEATTLPTGLTIPAPTISGATLTGTTSLSTTTFTGKPTFLASTTGGASFNIPAGTAPTVPGNGDFWTTTSGLFGRINGTTQGPYLYSVSTTGPLGGGGTGPTLTITCTTCATTTNGGALTATAPITISAAGLIALGGQPAPLTWLADAATTVHNDTYDLIETWPYTNSGTINTVTYHTGGTSTPGFTAAIQINGVAVTSCTGLNVTSSSNTTVTCTAAKTITNGQKLSLVISGTTGSPTSAVVQVSITKPAA